jgi:predicted nucleotidyltransferase
LNRLEAELSSRFHSQPNCGKIERMSTLEKVTKCLEDRPEVTAAYLFGSAAENCAVQNDVDIMVLLREGVDRFEAYLNLKLILARATGLAEEKIDLLFFDLNEASPHVVFQAVNKGVLIKNADPDELSDRIDGLSRYLLENEPVFRRAGRLRKNQLEAFIGTGSRTD